MNVLYTVLSNSTKKTLLEFGEYFFISTTSAIWSRWVAARQRNRPASTSDYETRLNANCGDEVADLQRKLENYRNKLNDYEAAKRLVSDL